MSDDIEDLISEVGNSLLNYASKEYVKIGDPADKRYENACEAIRTKFDALNQRIAELEADNAELKERVAMLDVTAVYKSLGEMGYIEQVDKLNARIAELKELLDTESQLSNQFYLLLVDNPKSKKLADDLIEALRINGKEVQE